MFKEYGRRFVPRRAAAFALAAAVCAGASAAELAVAPAAHAAARPAACSTYVAASAEVFDSYDHNEGLIRLLWNSCDNGWAGNFVSNSNTWKTVTVYVEYAYVYGYEDLPYGYRANWQFDSPWYHGTSCYYAEVDLVDNRGNENWVGTVNAGQGC